MQYLVFFFNIVSGSYNYGACLKKKIILKVPLFEIVGRISPKYFVQGYLHTKPICTCCCNLYAKGCPRTAGWWNGRTL